MRYSPKIVSATPATVSENISRGLFLEVVNNAAWRCYVASDTGDFEELCSRFMNVDARVPSIVEGENLALVPLHVFRFSAPSGTVFEGWLYLNGAVVVTRAGAEEETFLFIDSELAISTGAYPEEFFDYRVEQGEPQG